MIYKLDDGKKAEGLFAGWHETIIWSCLQGVMGHIYADDKDSPNSAMAILGDFCFFAGQPNKELVSFQPEWFTQDFIIMIPQNQQWADAIEDCYANRAKKVTRYAMKKERNVFDRQYLGDIVRELSDEYSIARINEEIFHICQKTEWCRDLVSQYADWQTYEQIGLGFIIRKDGQIVAGASSYSSYQGGIEIEIDTKQEYRRKGLGLVCGAKLVLECLDRGGYPSWDAQNTGSMLLAEKLGYHLDYEYAAYEVFEEEIKE